MESIPGKDAVKIAEMTTMDLEYYINLFHKPGERFERIDSNIEQQTSNVGKVLLNSIAYYRKIVQKRKYQLLWQSSGYLLRNCHSHLSHEIKRCLPLGRKAMTNLDSTFKKERHYFANRGPCSQSFGFSSSHVWMWELNYKES